MAPVTITETYVLDRHTQQLESIQYKATHQNEGSTNATSSKDQLSTYDEVLAKFKEPNFMNPIRQWEKRMGFVTPIRWTNAFFITAFHVICVAWFIRAQIYNFTSKWPTIPFAVIVGQLAGFGVTAGVHRYWCHRSYKAKWPLQVILIICYSIAGQNTILEWVRDHRVHHKFSETSADPHDANRGFFFSHVGWLMMKKHPDVIKEGRKLDLSDIRNDPLIQFHTRYFIVFKVLLCWVLPSIIPIYAWGEYWEVALVSQALVRYMCSLNMTWSVNSFAHLWGNKPYDRYIMPSENWGVSLVAMGEGWHNYHHTFPWDYKAAELGMSLNTTTTLLDFFARIGWAYDLKVASPALVDQVAKNKGDPNTSRI